jgi:hypothetical protein
MSYSQLYFGRWIDKIEQGHKLSCFFVDVGAVVLSQLIYLHKSFNRLYNKQYCAKIRGTTEERPVDVSESGDHQQAAPR